MLNSRRLILAHFWLAFAVFGLALIMGAWQMFIRSPLHTWITNPEWYYRSLTAHGTIMGYVFPTLVAMGFGYAISESALKQPLIGRRWAWAGFWLIVIGAVTAMVPVSLGRASVLYTFYPPLIGSPFYYIGVVLVVLGSWIWVALMSINLRIWKRNNPDAPVPLAMFANVAGAYLWAWTAVGAALELLFQILPVALGLKSTIDAGLARVFFSWTLHAIVYFWLMPTYIAYYTIVPRAIGGKLYSDSMGRIAFILFLVVAMPIGIHHAFADPQVGAGFKFIHSAFTALVALPTLLTVFTICASVEIAGRLRGGRGPLGWIATLPWNNPIMLATAFSFVLLGFGGAGGLINMSYQLDTTIHNTQWITGHFHLIFGGAIVIMYFAIAYDLWPHLTGRAFIDFRLMRLQLWLWFLGMIITTFPWHYVGILGMPRRMAYFDYTDPGLASEAMSVSMSAFGGLILLISGAIFILILIRGQRAPAMDAGEYRFSTAVHAPVSVPAALNSYGLWLALMIGLTVTNYGFPILQLAFRQGTSVPAVYIGAR
ncbi:MULTISPECIES: b(o/a)3-type cytochrome-c oxidase subunit 1 [unclassified Mesorhizobium]|uniref:b(o/a)3-type cytochrome-c oxidase subunit 1 n=1 Tax=unclassified Mesorhizobium TaxID=325217 RepID=UPI001128DB03|nr:MULTISPECIES: b(o/a)3-type cytochrome-c oxidase subunit 1 [unclassified Mesorhizobium]TPJ40977.1 b(o/a)3-type cytochrome-c oxidase subunit 1 [Mesorhizobium sp. B2-6-6]MCA0008686.1 b(o/a)3-type cytochrome-c oxidase subunit 1 [Mesorhizobium sp. B264B1B]MCA0019436.1 b(o/a)3-type cytochrome-c oxidase subunit 1 [Mesorhizobium sp. B264B1A]MCA0024523.1 b(o/a)3-type cytochrome-c oxidase subunit 1 [Mesorhizobium sp. B263B1A]MCA0055805.1 b(o/a)3-type cytochrome-c oxidase subunit 1 [Mesorhizobium sp. 